jgi:cytoskeletal protein RodZ
MADIRKARLLCISPLVLGLLLAIPLFSQAPAPSGEPKKTETAEPAQKERKVPLEEATRVSTDKALHSAAKEKSKPATEKNEVPELSGESEVTEFHPATPGEKNPGAEPTTEKPAKKSATKNIHGSVYGAGGAQGSGVGGAAGTTTKNGKTSVYVESEKSRTANPPPH